METKLTFSVIGGDRRQIECIHLLLDRGHRVNVLGLDNFKDSRANLFTKIQRELFLCDVLLLPIPYKNRSGHINIGQSYLQVSLSEIEEYLGDYKPLLVLGKADGEFEDLALAKGLSYIDITQLESFAILNAIPTAEGAIQRAMEMTDRTLHGSKILVLGYGRIGKSLSRMLKGIGADVSVEARKEEDLAWILENGYRPVPLKDLEGVLPFQDIILNTIPHLILDRKKLKKLSKNAIIIDLSSYPGGVDFTSAKELDIKASLDLGLPGKVAPITAGRIIFEVMMDCIGDRLK